MTGWPTETRAARMQELDAAARAQDAAHAVLHDAFISCRVSLAMGSWFRRRPRRASSDSEGCAEQNASLPPPAPLTKSLEPSRAEQKPKAALLSDRSAQKKQQQAEV